MPNYLLLTGCFEGSVVEEGTEILDLDFHKLDGDLQFRIREWAEQQLGRKYITIDGGENYAYKGGSNHRASLNDIKRDYEQSWDSEETDEEVNLYPLSQSLGLTYD